MTGRTFDGRPLTPGLNVDALDIHAGVKQASALGFGVTAEDLHVAAYALQRHARGEEDGAEKTWMGHFGKHNLTGWRMVLAAAMAGVQPAPAVEPVPEPVSLTVTVRRAPDIDVVDAERQWQAALRAAETAEQVYNAAIERDWGKP